MNVQTDKTQCEAQGGSRIVMRYSRRGWWQLRAVAPMLAMVLIAAACGSSEDNASATTASRPPSTTTTATTEAPTSTTIPASSSDDPASVLADYAEARNSGDVDAVMALYADDAVVRDHPLDDDDVAAGIDEIRVLQEQIPAIQGSGDGIEFFDMEVSGSTVIFSERFFYGSGGTAGCSGAVGNTAIVEDGKITLFEWGQAQPTLCR